MMPAGPSQDALLYARAASHLQLALAERNRQTWATGGAESGPQQNPALIRQHVEHALRCLYAILAQSFSRPLDGIGAAVLGAPTGERHSEEAVSTTTPQIQVRTRILLAKTLLEYTQNLDEALDHLHKAVSISKKMDLRPMEFSARDLQYQIVMFGKGNSGAAKSILKSLLDDSLRLGYMKQFYSTTIQLANHCIKVDDPVGCTAALSHGIEIAQSRADHQVQALLVILKIQATLLLSGYMPQRADELPVQCISEILTEANVSVFEPRVVMALLCLETLLLLHSEQTKLALSVLAKLHKFLDSALRAVRDGTGTSIWNEAILEIPLRTNGPEPTESLKVHFVDFARMKVLVYALSGIVSKLLDPGRARQLLLEAHKTVNKELSSQPRTTCSHGALSEHLSWLMLSEGIILQNLTEISLHRCEFSEAYRNLKAVSNWAKLFPVLSEPFHGMICLYWAMFYQSIEYTGEALKWYQSIATAMGNVQDDVVFAAKVNHAMILLCRGDMREQVADVLYQLECLPNLTGMQRSMLSLAKSLLDIQETQTQKAKVHLFEALKISEQLCSSQVKSMSLAFLGHVFIDTEPQQSERMFRMAYNLTQKAQSKGMIPHCGKMWCVLSERLMAQPALSAADVKSRADKLQMEGQQYRAEIESIQATLVRERESAPAG
ncbi:cohesin loading factor-domain-containing protein [Polychytrium aggregatum]|uniref:cohesin loading factor-domain-containing protein n=1 Tax=Polychytrium aggregatum TaxID=110093 RepID=UPI0022FE5085|nr:cohesin loading factor-domain-containing protein [Polychytrium aggregatum]KAI9209498.1 cohesin loading factor-domain-containing protein [Polychytrium aggregatum]